MANEHDDALNKVVHDLPHDKQTLQSAMQDLQHLKGEDLKIDPDGTKNIWKNDIAQISKSVDLAGLGLAGFHVLDSGTSDKGTPLMVIGRGGAKQGDAPIVGAIDSDGSLYKVDISDSGDAKVTGIGSNVFAQADKQTPDVPPPAKPQGDAQPPVAPPAKPQGDAQPPVAPADAPPAQAPSDRSFGDHGRTFDLTSDGKAVYIAKHGDTYWSVAKDLLTKADHKPTNSEINAEVKALAALNNKSDANKLKVGEPIIVPITPPAPEGAKPAPEGAKPAPEGAKPAPEGAKPAPEGAKPAPEGAKPAPEGAKPAPEGAKPAPEGAKPAPEGAKPAPEGAKPAPEGAKPAPEGAKPVPTAQAPLGFDMKAHANALKPQSDVYSPLSPLGMSGAGLDPEKATLSGEASKPVVKGTETTQETDMNLKDGPWYLAGFGRTGVINTDVTDGNILKSRETKYSSALDMKMAGPLGPVELHGVSLIHTDIDPKTGNYLTAVTAGDGEHHFVTDSTGKVRQYADAHNSKVATLDPPSKEMLAALNSVSPVAIADNSTGGKSQAAGSEAPKIDAIDPP